jgi:hypothetical protein
MNNIIQQNANDYINFFKKNLKKFLKGEYSFDDCVKNFMSDTLKNINTLFKQFIEALDKEIEDNEARKKNYYLIKKKVKRTIMYKSGNIEIIRNYYKNKKTNEYKYLLDEALGLEKKSRLSDSCIESILKEVVESSYKKAGEAASLRDKVTKQTVKNIVHKLEITQPQKKIGKKKGKKILYIEADEDHVSLQKVVKVKGKKINTAMPKIVTIYEDVIPESGEGTKSKRMKKINKFYLAGLYQGKESQKIWEEASEYIDRNYRYDELEKIYLNGDGAKWIKSGCDIIEKSIFVLDKFHTKKVLNECTTHLEKEMRMKMKEELNRNLYTMNKKEFFRILELSKDCAKDESKKVSITKKINYFKNNWNAIKIQIEDKDNLKGCSAEGQVSHVLSSRLSSRPLGWSVVGLDRMSKLRAYKYNEGDMLELIKRIRKPILPSENFVDNYKNIFKKHKGKEIKIENCKIPGISETSMSWLRDLVGNSKIKI